MLCMSPQGADAPPCCMLACIHLVAAATARPCQLYLSTLNFNASSAWPSRTAAGTAGCAVNSNAWLRKSCLLLLQDPRYTQGHILCGRANASALARLAGQLHLHSQAPAPSCLCTRWRCCAGASRSRAWLLQHPTTLPWAGVLLQPLRQHMPPVRRAECSTCSR